MRKLAKLNSSLWRQLQLLSETRVAFLALTVVVKGMLEEHIPCTHLKEKAKEKWAEVKLFSQLQLLIYI